MNEKLLHILGDKNKTYLFTGIGNVLRNDDGTGIYITKKIKETRIVSTLLAEVSLENYVGKINRLNPSVLILVDCLDFNREPGHWDIIPAAETREFTINSHHLSIKRLSEFFKMETWLLGIQPANLKVGENLTTAVKKSADEIVEMINQLSR